MRAVFGKHQLDTEARSLYEGERRISIQAKAFDVLVYLIEHRERVVSTGELLDALWPELHVTPAAVSIAVQKARHAVGDDGHRQSVLRTDRAHGFQFVADIRILPDRHEEAAPRARVHASRRERAPWTLLTGPALLLAAASVWLLRGPAAAP
ncbi:MAG: winged helix-turn-helix domain-containing protein, partial [Myxococcales bacterium]|nr:winged helix-turn-helix domain-containing protein [Myxococcales bacterium]